MKTFQELQEGLYDTNIFKAFYLDGGPGSGKSYVASKATGGTGLKMVNSDPAFEHLLKKAGLSLKMPPEEFERKEVVRGKAKKITSKMRANYLEGRLGLIIDGTGKDADKILYQKNMLDELGYDTYMIYVNTSVDIALKRNAERPRSLPEDDVVKMWKAVMNEGLGTVEAQANPLDNVRQTQATPTPGGILQGEQPQVKSEKDGMWDSILSAGSRTNVLK